MAVRAVHISDAEICDLLLQLLIIVANRTLLQSYVIYEYDHIIDVMAIIC